MPEPTTIAAKIATLTQFDHFVGEVPATTTKPYVIYYPAAGAPVDRRIDGQAHRSAATSQAMCVNNNADGAVFVAKAVVDLLDGWELSGNRVTCWVGPTIADPDMQAGYRWSVTVEISHETNR